MLVADLRQADADGFDTAGGLTDLHDVADEVLVFKEDEEAGDEVGDKALSAQAGGKAQDAGAGEDWPRVDAEHAEHDDARAEIKHILAERLQERQKRLHFLIDDFGF